MGSTITAPDGIRHCNVEEAIMAWQYPVHSCGHKGARYQAYGPCEARERKLRAIEAQPCPDCRKAAADKAAAGAGLPALKGSPKQVAWAHEIRERALRILSPERAERIRAEASASWWIEHRSALGS